MIWPIPGWGPYHDGGGAGNAEQGRRHVLYLLVVVFAVRFGLQGRSLLRLFDIICSMVPQVDLNKTLATI